MPLPHGQASGTTTFIWKLYEPVLPAHVENTVKIDDKVALCHQQRHSLVISTTSSAVTLPGEDVTKELDSCGFPALLNLHSL